VDKGKRGEYLRDKPPMIQGGRVGKDNNEGRWGIKLRDKPRMTRGRQGGKRLETMGAQGVRLINNLANMEMRESIEIR
jgi:hypothetical protein